MCAASAQAVTVTRTDAQQQQRTIFMREDRVVDIWLGFGRIVYMLFRLVAYFGFFPLPGHIYSLASLLRACVKTLVLHECFKITKGNTNAHINCLV